MIRLLLLFALLAQPALGAEPVYRIVHPDGTVEFTDEPSPRGELIEIPPVPTYAAPPAPAPRPAAPPKPPAKPTIAITQPAPGETFWVDDWQITVRVVATPTSSPKQSREVELLLDEAPLVRGAGPELILAPVYRGEHSVVARLLDDGGNELARSAPVVFYVQKHNVPQDVPQDGPQEGLQDTLSLPSL